MNERIKELRKSLGLTMEKFGERLGVGKVAISYMESGKRGITEQTIKSICREFRVNEDWLLNGTGEMFLQTPSSALEELQEELGLTDLEVSFAREYLKLDEEKRNIFRDFFYNVMANTAASAEKTAASAEKNPASPEAPPPDSIAEAEAAYIKSRSDSAQNAGLSASSVASADSKKDVS